MLKYINVPDIHLYDKNIAYSVKYIEQSIAILDELYRMIKEGEYDFIVLGGDIQHEHITNSKLQSHYMQMLKKISDTTIKNLIEKDLYKDIKIIDRQTDVKKESYLFTLKGNHDISKRTNHSYYDLLIENDIIRNPLEIWFKDMRINLVNWVDTGHEDDLIIKPNTNAIYNIAHYHNLIKKDEVMLDGFAVKGQDPEKIGLFKGIDVAIINDIHSEIPTYTLNGATVYTTGSLARTSFTKSQDKDYGKVTEIHYTKDGIKHQTRKFNLIPSNEYFKKDIIKKDKVEKNLFKDFVLDLEKVQITYRDIKQELLENEILSNDIKELCSLLVDRNNLENIKKWYDKLEVI